MRDHGFHEKKISNQIKLISSFTTSPAINTLKNLGVYRLFIMKYEFAKIESSLITLERTCTLDSTIVDREVIET